MSFKAAVDVPMIVRSENSNIERRISPAWTISYFKARLEPITGVPAACQKLTLNTGTSQSNVSIEAVDEDAMQLSAFPLQAYAEIYVHDTRPPAVRALNSFNDLSSVQRFVLTTEAYEALPETVLAYKRSNQIGRFNPAAPAILEKQSAVHNAAISARGIVQGMRCRLLPANSDDRRGVVRHVGEVEGLPGVGPWVGIALDEPTGRNDGCGPGGIRYFECGKNCGLFVRPERIEMGQFEDTDGLEDEEDFHEDLEEM